MIEHIEGKMPPKKLKLVRTEFESSGDYTQSSFDGLQMYKYLKMVMDKKEKDEIIIALMSEICYLTHFIAHKNDEYIKFRNKVKNTPILDDDLLEWTINPPQIDLNDPNIIVYDKEFKPSEDDDLGRNKAFLWEKE